MLKQAYLLRFLSFRFILGAGLLVTFLLCYWHWLAYQQFITTPIHFSTQQQTLTIKPGESVNLLARRWQQQGLISNQYYFRLFYTLNPELKNIKMGEYQLDPQETPESLMLKLSLGQVIQYAFTIVEGMNSFQIIASLSQNSLLRDDLDEYSENLTKALGISENHIEGWLFPDTYYFSKNDSAFKLLRRATRKMQQVLEQEWQNRASGLPYESPYQALVMASIIEKETADKSERNLIAGVFVRRLQLNMRLQTDPTVIYGIGPDFNGDITYKDLRTKTAYNTYLFKGLPPTPIAMPGREAIYAALHPAAGDALYFVASGDGGHQFSATLAEHNRAVRKYIKKRKK